MEDAGFDPALVAEMERNAPAMLDRPIRFSTPTFKEYRSDELDGCGKNSFPAFSITAGGCALMCDHCQASILEPMIPATSPDMLDRKVRDLVLLQDLQGFLLSGGSNRRNEIAYERFYPVVEGLKRDFPHLKIAIHSALLDERRARLMESAGVDTAMMDVIGAQETIERVYHLDRPVDDFEATLAALCSTSMEVVPHIVAGLQYGRLLGEANALDICSRYGIHALVLVVIMPFYARAGNLRDAGHRGGRPAVPRCPAPDRRASGIARLRPAGRHAQAGDRRLCRDGRAGRHRLPGGRRGCSGRRPSAGRWSSSMPAVRSRWAGRR